MASIYSTTNRKKTKKKLNLINQPFGNWTVKHLDPNRKPNHNKWWVCVCVCGNTSTVSTSNLLNGNSLSCGCTRMTQNGLSTSREYIIWAKMICRCHNPQSQNYRYYGGQGIFVCERWQKSFLHFLSDMDKAPSKQHSIDRINTTGSYTCGKCSECRSNNTPLNCRWASKAEQARNQKSNRYYTHDGKTLILKDWARLVGINYLTLWNRLKSGLSFADAISIQRYNRKAIKSAKR